MVSYFPRIVHDDNCNHEVIPPTWIHVEYQMNIFQIAKTLGRSIPSLQGATAFNDYGYVAWADTCNRPSLHKGYSRITIFIAKEVQLSSCEQAAVENHEWDHIRRDELALTQQVQSIKYSTNVLPLLKFLNIHPEETHREIDTTENYLEITSHCWRNSHDKH